MNIPRSAVDSKAEDMRIWAGSKGETKADWDLTFHGFLRRDAQKLAASVAHHGPAAVTITPHSPSWNAWKTHFRDSAKNFQASHMDKLAGEGKPFTVPSEWPPQHGASGHREAQ
jgi:hypothetical protein